MGAPYVTGSAPDIDHTLNSAKALDRHLQEAINDLAPQKGQIMPPPLPGSFAASLRAMMDEARAGIEQARADGLSKVSDAVTKLNEAKVATAKVAGVMAQTITEEADAVMAELGQITNHPPE